MFDEIIEGLAALYREDDRPWLVGFSGGKDSTMVLSLVMQAIDHVPANKKTKTVSVLCTDTRVEIPAVVSMIEMTLGKIRDFAHENSLPVEVYLLRPPAEQGFWVNIIGRG